MRYPLTLASIVLLSNLNIRCASDSHDKVLDSIHRYNAEIQLGIDQQLIKLNEASTVNSDINLADGTQTSEVEIKGGVITYGANGELTVSNSSDAATQKHIIDQTGKSAKPLSMTEAIIDINVILPPLNTRVDNAIRDNIATSLHGVLTGSGALAGSDWLVYVRRAAKDGQIYRTRAKVSDPLGSLKTNMRAAGAESEHSEGYWNPLPLTAMSSIRNDPNLDARVFLIVADRDLFCRSSSGYGNGCVIIPLQWGAMRADAKKAMSIYGLLRPDYGLCSDVGCKPTAGKCGYSGSEKRIAGNSIGCYYDKTEQFTIKQVNGSLPFCGARGVLVNPCYKKSDSYKKYLGGWLSACGAYDNSCYASQTIGGANVYTPAASKLHFFNMATTYDNQAYLINRMADDIKAQLAKITTGAKPFIADIDLPYSQSKVASVSLSYTTKDGSTTNLQSSAFTVSYPNDLLKITLNNPEQDFPEGSWMTAIVTFSESVAAFPLSHDETQHLVVEHTEVLVDGKESNFTASSTGKETTITLKATPKLGAKVVIKAAFIQTTSEVAIIADSALTCYNKTKQEQAVDCESQGSETVSFTNPSQISASDKIEITQKKAGITSIALQSGAILATLKLAKEDSNESCAAAADQLVIIGLDVNIEQSSADDKCPMLKGKPKVAVTYDVTNGKDKYDLHVPAELLQLGEWSVSLKIAGKEAQAGVDYVIDKQDRTITFLKLDTLAPNTDAILTFN
ncbi:MAG: hypothetical protein OYH77_05870 [Pseudomonadota bacterium]|nr:hypothetical protein [Pseudomonadota bacterium]